MVWGGLRVWGFGRSRLVGFAGSVLSFGAQGKYMSRPSTSVDVWFGPKAGPASKMGYCF